MPHPGTHVTIVQRLAIRDPKFQALLGNPDPNANNDPNGVNQMQFASLGAIGPDIFYAMLDYHEIGGATQAFEDFVIKLLGSFDCITDLMSKISNQISQFEQSVLQAIPCSSLFTAPFQGLAEIKNTFGGLSKALNELILSTLAANFNGWPGFQLQRQKDIGREQWYWADYLHYVHTGKFVGALIAKSKTPPYDAHPNLQAFALGYMTHYVTDTVGHSYVNNIVQAPYRLYWQRHALVENFIDTYVWNEWHYNTGNTNQNTGEMVLDNVIPDGNNQLKATYGDCPYNYARLNDLIFIGSPSIDPIEQVVQAVCNDLANMIQKVDLLNIFGAQLSQSPQHPDFQLWAQMLEDTLVDVYGPINHPTNLPWNNGIPTVDDITSSYGLFRLVLKLSTEDKIDAPQFPNIVGDISNDMSNLWNQLKQDLGSIPPPPSTGGSFSWDALLSWLEWAGEVLDAIGRAVWDTINSICQIATDIPLDVLKAFLFILNLGLWDLYRVFRRVLVYQAYSGPLIDQLQEDVGNGINATSLWKIQPVNMPYPVEEYVDPSTHDMPEADVTGKYQPVVPPSSLSGVQYEHPSVDPVSPYQVGNTPDAFTDNSFSGGTGGISGGTAVSAMLNFELDQAGNIFATMPGIAAYDGSPPTTFRTANPNVNMGGAIDNCKKAIAVVEAILGGTPISSMPNSSLEDKLQAIFPDYNLDSDRGYAWPCWEVDPNSNTKLNPSDATNLPQRYAVVNAKPWQDNDTSQ
jgi:hypothetical protein